MTAVAATAAILSLLAGCACLGWAGWLAWGGGHEGPNPNPCLWLENFKGPMPEATYHRFATLCALRRAAALGFGAGGLAALACGGAMAVRLRQRH